MESYAKLLKNYGIGLTGGIAVGKSAVTRIIENEGFKVFDADKMARQVVEAGTDGLKKIVALFGESVLNKDDSLDRKKLGQLIFNDPEKKRSLEQIVHPAIEQYLKLELEKLKYFQEPEFFFMMQL